MKYSYLKLSLWSLLFVGLSNGAIAQATNGVVNNNVFQSGYFLGWNGTNGANPLLIKTNNITRMHFNGSTVGYSTARNSLHYCDCCGNECVSVG
jgi:hypothetical protein